LKRCRSFPRSAAVDLIHGIAKYRRKAADERFPPDALIGGAAIVGPNLDSGAPQPFCGGGVALRNLPSLGGVPRPRSEMLVHYVVLAEEASLRPTLALRAMWGLAPDAEVNRDGVELVVGVSRDTSERRSFEEELRKNEARLRAATELAGLGIYSWDPVTGAAAQAKAPAKRAAHWPP
jgi:PAS domain-containing protein